MIIYSENNTELYKGIYYNVKSLIWDYIGLQKAVDFKE